MIDRYLKAARAAKALLILDIQPGHVDFMQDVRALRPYLEQPDVSLALDPEWKVPAGQIPGKVIGSTDAADVNRVSAYLAAIVRAQQAAAEAAGGARVHGGDGPAQAAPPAAAGGGADPERRRLRHPARQDRQVPRVHPSARPCAGFHAGFKLFFHEDTNLMSPRQVLRLRPRPSLVVYE